MGNISLTLNGTPVSAPQGMTILEVARENGIDIPTMCYLKDLAPVGACRLCVVEVEGSRTLVGSCHTPVTPGMVIQTHSPKVLEVRRVLIELMMASHPDTCIVCEAANCCELRLRATDLEVGMPRFRTRMHYFPVEDENPSIIRDMSKCILCRRCVAACDNIEGKKMFSLAYRGFETKVIYDLDKPIGSNETCRDCKTCITLCPTGALRLPMKFGQEKKGPVLYVKG
ncbi:MAG TPA: 2Fe-2S iron-sulfur cluster-binding protein [Dehalococcoidales bacterium]|nr:2Fe-2S iron-sulfur cluster-binding protein [Dehalococcoidales bacterium]